MCEMLTRWGELFHNIIYEYQVIMLYTLNILQFYLSVVCMCTQSLQSCPALCIPMDYSPLAPLSKRLSRQEYWSTLLRPPPGDLLNPGIEPRHLLCLLQCKQILYPLSCLGATHQLYLNKNENK